MCICGRGGLLTSRMRWMWPGQGPASCLNCPAVLILEFQSSGDDSPITLPCRVVSPPAEVVGGFICPTACGVLVSPFGRRTHNPWTTRQVPVSCLSWHHAVPHGITTWLYSTVFVFFFFLVLSAFSKCFLSPGLATVHFPSDCWN